MARHRIGIRRSGGNMAAWRRENISGGGGAESGSISDGNLQKISGRIEKK